MTALEAVAAYLPGQRVPIEDLAGELGLTRIQVRVFQRYHGLARVCRAPERTPLDLLRAAVAELAALRGREHQVRYVLYARGMPVAAPYPRNPLHELCRELGLGRAAAFTVTQQACAASLLAVDLAGRLLAAGHEPGALALVLAGEKAFTRVARLVPETSIFAEGAAACLVSAHGARDRLLAYASRSRGEFDGGPGVAPGEQRALAARFQQEFPRSLSEVILAAASRAGTSLDQIGLILPHNVNAVSWRQWCKEAGYPLARVLLDNVPAAGHSFCADPFINYRTAADRGLLHPGEKYLVAAAGAGPGATFSAMVFEH
ncbi:MAG TPA: 3-oxoacyl-[acyl-carrier-protein] synthase III C-terminal domain-containing protein [Streptosporangiaceae bacterium]